MKLTAIILTACCLQVAARGYSQNLSLSVKEMPFAKVCNLLAKESGYQFLYNNQVRQTIGNITISVTNENIENVVTRILAGYPYDFFVDNKVIIIRNKPQPKPENKPDTTNPAVVDVRGSIKDEKGKPISRATITLKGTARAVASDEYGFFAITNTKSNDQLIITSIGYEDLIIPLKGKPTLDITLHTTISVLDETVIKGYYSTTRRLNTGNVSTLKGEDIQKQPVSDPIASLEGRITGLQITQNSGVPGSSFSILLRGQSSIQSGNDPLFLVDGVPFTSNTLSSNKISPPAGEAASPFNSLNPQDIESIEVLKDADATAIYGSRGANGVIIINTKKGKIGKTKLDINYYTGFGKISRKIDFLNTSDYLQLRHEAFNNDDITTLPPNAYDINGKWDTTRYTDWQKVFIGGTSATNNGQLSLSGGNINTQFLIGAGIHKETTVFPGQFSDLRGSLHMNLTHLSEDKRLNTNLSIFSSEENNILPQTDFTNLINLPPDAPAVYDSLGKLNWQNSTWTNPFASELKRYKSITNNLIGNLEISYELFVGLFIKGNFGYNAIEGNQTITNPKSSFNPAFTAVQASANFSNNSIKKWNIEPQLSYDKQIGQSKFNLLLGSTFLSQIQNNITQTGTGFTSDALIEDLQAASAIRVNGQDYSQYNYNAVFGRLSYNLQDKYLINVTGRRDGSSRFGPGKQFANFEAVGVSWIFSNENLIKKKFNDLSYGKIRASYGSSGNDNIGNYQFLDTYSPSGISYQGITSLYPVQLYNSNFAWEINRKFELGLELGFFNNRVLLNGAYYRNRSSNQLVGYALPTITGFSSITANLNAVVQNSGFEIEFTTINIKSKDLNWNTSFNISLPQNKLISYPNLAGSAYANQYIIGEPLSISKLYKYIGIDGQKGTYSFFDYDHDGNISYPNDLQNIVFTGQNFYGGLQNSLHYKSWQFDIFFQFVKQANGRNSFTSFGTPGVLGNQPQFIYDNTWKSVGDQSLFQKLTATNSNVFTSYSNMSSSNFAYSNASFIRLKNLSLSYQISDLWKADLGHTGSLKMYIQAQNLITFTKYRGLDPETKGFLPVLKVVTAGLLITL